MASEMQGPESSGVESEGAGRGGKGAWETNEMGEKEALSSSFHATMTSHCPMVSIATMTRARSQMTPELMNNSK